MESIEIVMLKPFQCCWMCPQLGTGTTLKGKIVAGEFHPDGVDYAIPGDVGFYEEVSPLESELVNNTFAGFCRGTEACL